MVEIRATRPEERRAAANVVSAALLHSQPDDEAWEKSVPSWDGADSLSAWDGDACVGHAAGYRVDTIVPGGARLATSAVSRVGVAATARRRGVATALMRQLVTEAAARGQVLASLRASEAVIYSRFGFGVAGLASEIRFRPGESGPLRGVAPGSMRILPIDELLDVVPPLYDHVATRPGIITRPEFLWKRYLEDALKAGGDAHYIAVHADPGGVDDGFVHYFVKWSDESFEDGAGIGEFFDLFGATPGVELALWSYLADIDLVRTWTASERPVDDVVRLAMPNQRAYSIRNGGWDEQWLRLLDVDAALTARTYGDTTSSVTIAVDDDLLAHNTGVWHVDSNGAKRLGGVNPDSADLATDIAALSATYLGGFRWSALAAAGRVQVADAEALAAADTLFLSPVAPFCGSFF
ncbi:MAG: GNAT family N-acetyltransferase [Acidimicrobiia bacterium]|nr:GNAT family N-acetyltransferase [Acidimicrobiia bacterium]